MLVVRCVKAIRIALCRDARSGRPLCQSKTSNGCMDARSCVRCIKGYSVRVLTGTDAQIVRPYNRYSSRSSGTDARPSVPTGRRLTPPRHFDALRLLRPHTSEEIKNISVANGNPPRRNKKNHWNFDLLLPKFHFILPNFYLPVPWRIFVCSLAVFDFLGRDCNQWRFRREFVSTYSRGGATPRWGDTASLYLFV